MKIFLVLLNVFVGISAFAESEERQVRPANEYCWVWIAGQDGVQIDRKEIRFVMDPSKPSTEIFELEFDVDSEVKGEIYADPSKYILTLFKRDNKLRPLASGLYRRTAKLVDFHTSGFEVFTETAQYQFSCITESYIE